jgi:cobalt-zinc-cadmium efflux system outer membrane protein
MKLPLFNRRGIGFAILFVLFTSVSHATEIDIATAVSRTLEASPELQRYPFQVRLLEGEALQASLLPNPTLHVDLENAFGSGESRFLAGYELTLSLSQVIEMGQKREKRVNLVDQKSLSLQHEYETKRLDVIASLLRDYYQVLRLQHLMVWNTQRIKAEQAALNIIERRANAGVVGKADVIRMQLRLAKSKTQQSEFSTQHQNALNLLATHWAASADFDAVTGDITTTPTAPDLTTLQLAIESTPDYLLSQAQRRISEAQLSLAQAESQADLTVSAGVRRLEANDDNAFVFGFSMPLQFNNRNQGNIAAAQAHYEQSLLEQTLLKTQLETALTRINSALASNLRQIEVVTTELTPVAHALLEEVKHGYKLGLYSVLQWVDAQDELFNIERDRIEAQYATHLQYLELERLSGTRLNAQVSTKE